MFDGAKMLGGMFVFGGVAAAYVTAGQAQAQVDPLVSHLQAFFAALGFGLYVADLIGMRANICHLRLLGA
jgi:hypothetical protein